MKCVITVNVIAELGVEIKKLRSALIECEPQIFDDWMLFNFRIINGWGD